MGRRLLPSVIAFVLLGGTASAALEKAGDPKKRHTAADQAWAHAIPIRAADVAALDSGRWHAERAGDNGKQPKSCDDPDQSDLVETGAAEAPTLSRSGSFLGSTAGVYASEQQATAAWRRFTAQGVTRCWFDSFRSEVTGPSLRVHVLSNGPLTIAQLAPHFAAARVRFVLEGPAATIQGHISGYIYARGRAVAMVMFASFGRPFHPISPSLERKLAALVGRRLHR